MCVMCGNYSTSSSKLSRCAIFLYTNNKEKVQTHTPSTPPSISLHDCQEQP